MTFQLSAPGADYRDRRVRRALTLAIDRYEGSRNLSRIAAVKEVAGIQVPGTPWATPPEELARLAGYWRDVGASRAEARRLLKEAGAEGLSFTYKNRGIPMPYELIGIWLIDQWRQVRLSLPFPTHAGTIATGPGDVYPHCAKAGLWGGQVRQQLSYRLRSHPGPRTRLARPWA